MSKIQTHLNTNDYIVIKLKNFLLKKGNSEQNKKIAKSLLCWYQNNNSFTKAQRSLAGRITYVRKTKSTKKKHYLYAISNGEQIKLGMSSNIKKRIESLQTSCPTELVLLWKYYIANTAGEAIKIEKQLHRACKKFHIRGEWFSRDCIEIVNKFNPNKKHCAKWECAKLITVDKKRTNKILNFTVEAIRKTDVTNNMYRVWEQKDTIELYQQEIKALLEMGEVVLVEHD